MRLAECEKLKEGDKVRISMGNGWYMTGEFVRLVECTKFPKSTFDDIKTVEAVKRMMSKGRKCRLAEVLYVDEGKTTPQGCYVNPRRLSLV